MQKRQRVLPAGWYPADKKSTIQNIEKIRADLPLSKQSAVGGVVPHAGWVFSGKAALQVFLSCPEDIDTCVIIGGHMAPGQGILAAFEDEFETPLGPLLLDREMLSCLESEIELKPDHYADNTVEIQLPMVKYCFPETSIIWLRASPSREAILLGKALFAAAAKFRKKTAVFGSTDLTHYGSNYGFAPPESRPDPLQWVKTKNDKKIIAAMLSMEGMDIIDAANEDSSACSAGGAAAAASYAKAAGAEKGVLLSYYTSHDVYPSGDSFVGYAGIMYPVQSP
ncbi:MAG: AmmeMemoRadiSam system protein B [Spirochaetales bacterium]|nr:AmmeMemoRadiSam system protein B [Spirochaetales bacterium]